MVVIIGGYELDKLFRQVGVLEDGDTYNEVMCKVERGIKGLTDQATER